LYREDAREAVRLFRPVLRKLKIRSETGHLPVFLAAFDQLAFLNLDECSIQFAVGDIDSAGIFIIRHTPQGLLRAYIILNRQLYTNIQDLEMKKIRKIAGVHEFTHFLAIIYVATVNRRSSLKSLYLQRLQHTVEKLWGPNLLELYYALSGRPRTGYEPPELTDSHFRLGSEGQTIDYEVLFLHFMFSRELFEGYFNNERQEQFRNLCSAGQTENAIQLLLDTLNTAATDKDVPLNTAKNQLFQWAHVYMRPNNAPAAA
jgi:hypothetical protein